MINKSNRKTKQAIFLNKQSAKSYHFYRRVDKLQQKIKLHFKRESETKEWRLSIWYRYRLSNITNILDCCPPPDLRYKFPLLFTWASSRAEEVLRQPFVVDHGPGQGVEVNQRREDTSERRDLQTAIMVQDQRPEASQLGEAGQHLGGGTGQLDITQAELGQLLTQRKEELQVHQRLWKGCESQAVYVAEPLQLLDVVSPPAVQPQGLEQRQPDREQLQVPLPPSPQGDAVQLPPSEAPPEGAVVPGQVLQHHAKAPPQRPTFIQQLLKVRTSAAHTQLVLPGQKAEHLQP